MWVITCGDPETRRRIKKLGSSGFSSGNGPELELLTSKGESQARQRSNSNVITITNTFLEYLLATEAHPLHGKGYPATYDVMTTEQFLRGDC